MSDEGQSRLDQIVDLLTDEVLARIEERKAAASAVVAVRAEQDLDRAAATEPGRSDRGTVADEAMEPGEPVEPGLGLETPVTGPLHASRLMWRLAIGLLVAVVLINIPLNRHGTRLATAMPDTASLIIRDGLVVKEKDDEEIYIYQDNAFRWISSMDAFEHLALTWDDVHVVEDGFLDRYKIGTPVHVLLKCWESPHIYRLEGGVKRWIVDIETFESEGHKWEDVHMVSCDYLRKLPDGETIPPDQGPPPQP